MSIEIIPGAVPIHLWAHQVDVEKQAIGQLYKLAALPWVFHHVAVMPDVHLGKGATVGSVIAMKDAVSPAAVGVDIGCGMGAVKTTLKASELPNGLAVLRSNIEAAIPVGFNAHDKASFQGLPEGLKRYGHNLFSRFKDLTPKVQDRESRAMKQVGTLGGGNHFIEVCLDEGICGSCGGSGRIPYTPPHPVFKTIPCDGCAATGKGEPNVWLMLHSGSRNIGKELAEYHINVARHLAHNATLPDKDLAVFLAGTPEMEAYRHDLLWAQDYAKFNRTVMLVLFKKVIRDFFPATGRSKNGFDDTVGFDEPILCHHNYVSEETHFGENVIVTRKGAISARKGEMGIIPGSMGTRSYIVRGLGNAESFHSASHGAGRRMSRGEAKRTFTQADFEAQTAGVCCRKDLGVLDEIPGSYKDIEQVMDNQKDLVEVVSTLKQVLCVKG